MTNLDSPARTTTSDTTHTAGAAGASLLLVATRALGGLHALLGVGALGLAAWAVSDYRNAGPDDSLAGLALFFGAGIAFLGLVLVVLGAATALARRPAASYGLGLAAGLFVMATRGALDGWFALYDVLGAVVIAGSLALVVCSAVGLATHGRK